MLTDDLKSKAPGDVSAAVHQAMKALDLAYEAGKASPQGMPRHPFVETSRQQPLVGAILDLVEASAGRSVYRLTKRARDRYAGMLLKDLFALQDTKQIDRKRLARLFRELDAIEIPGQAAH